MKKLTCSLVFLGLSMLYVSCHNETKTSTTIKTKTDSIRIISGDERTQVYFPLLTGKGVAVVANHASLIGRTNLVDSLKNSGIIVCKIFSPEHGFRGTADAGEEINNSVDKVTGIPIISLYGKHNKPSGEDLKGVDIVVFDIQDVGVRFYTYLSTLHYVMEACAEYNVKLILLDRANPNAYYIDGPVLDTTYSSFVGLHPVPIVYGMTIGEYAQMINGEKWLTGGIQCDLQVIPCLNYTHSKHSKLKAPPSPSLRTLDAVYLYPSLALFEGTCMSIGRGTDFPFQVYGHPEFPKGNFNFTPVSANNRSALVKHSNQLCNGIDLRNSVNPDSLPGFTLKWLINAYQQMPGDTKFFNNFFTNLSGTTLLRQQIVQGLDEATIRAGWQPDLDKFKTTRKKYLIYPDFY